MTAEGVALERCVWCGGDVVPGSTCPRSLTCRRCGAEPGRPCKRPTGHPSSSLHAGRVGDAERRDAELAAALAAGALGHETQTVLELEGAVRG